MKAYRVVLGAQSSGFPHHTNQRKFAPERGWCRIRGSSWEDLQTDGGTVSARGPDASRMGGAAGSGAGFANLRRLLLAVVEAECRRRVHMRRSPWSVEPIRGRTARDMEGRGGNAAPFAMDAPSGRPAGARQSVHVGFDRPGRRGPRAEPRAV